VPKWFRQSLDEGPEGLQSGQDGSERERRSHGHPEDDPQARDDS
jgi:hypothetical protein